MHMSQVFVKFKNNEVTLLKSTNSKNIVIIFILSEYQKLTHNNINININNNSRSSYCYTYTSVYLITIFNAISNDERLNWSYALHQGSLGLSRLTRFLWFFG